MLKTVLLAIATGVVLAMSPTAVEAQCLSFSKDVACTAKPSIRPNFGVPKDESRASTPTPAPGARRAAMPGVTPREADAIDCQMTRRVDPSFHSNMPVVTPDPNVNFVIKVVPVPACKP